MEKLWEKLEAAVLMLECIWRVRECENSYAAERAYAILDEFLKRDGEESLEEVRELARKIDEVLMECECDEDV
jgi:reverse gyrase